MFLQNERGLGLKNGTLGTVVEVSTQSMAVRIDDGRDVAFDLKDYNKIDHGYAATVHKAQGMTVDRAHVLATPSMDGHGSYIALSRHRDGMDLHYGRDDFASQDKLINVLEAALRRARGRALVRHARAVDAIFAAQEQGGKASPDQVRELQEARQRFEEVRPYGSHDAEAAYKKNPELAAEAASGNARRAIRALQLEAELRTEPAHRADRFVERWRELGQASQRQYQTGDMSGYRSTRAEMGNMAKSLECDPQLESILAGRKRELGIAFDSGRSLGRGLAFTHGIDFDRGHGLGL